MMGYGSSLNPEGRGKSAVNLFRVMRDGVDGYQFLVHCVLSEGDTLDNGIEVSSVYCISFRRSGQWRGKTSRKACTTKPTVVVSRKWLAHDEIMLISSGEAVPSLTLALREECRHLRMSDFKHSSEHLDPLTGSARGR